MKLKLLIIICFLTLILTTACSNTDIRKIQEPKTDKSNKLTVEIVKDLSDKRDKLTWEDFQPYESKDLGSGLYIKLYPIDDKYELLIGGGSLTKEPMYINLVDKSTKKSIDIRQDDVDEFIYNVP